jgi:hypothetical protein
VAVCTRFRQRCPIPVETLACQVALEVSKQQLAALRGKGHSNASVRWSEHPSPLSGSLN